MIVKIYLNSETVEEKVNYGLFTFGIITGETQVVNAKGYIHNRYFVSLIKNIPESIDMYLEQKKCIFDVKAATKHTRKFKRDTFLSPKDCDDYKEWYEKAM